jgi:hypothetical protein
MTVMGTLGEALAQNLEIFGTSRRPYKLVQNTDPTKEQHATVQKDLQHARPRGTSRYSSVLRRQPIVLIDRPALPEGYPVYRQFA